MVSRSAQPIQVQAARGWRMLASTEYSGGYATCLAPSLEQSALAFAAYCHAGRRREGDGAPFIKHPLEVARLLRQAGCSDVVVVAGLLHDVIDDTQVSVAELTARFGPDVAGLVRAVSEDTSVSSYRQRKQELREQVQSTGGEAPLLFAAEKIAEVHELPDQVRRNRGPFRAARGSRARHLEHHHYMRLEHYHESLAMLQQVAPRHLLVKRLEAALDDFATAAARPAPAAS